MTVRPPLAKGDDGSSFRYEVRPCTFAILPEYELRIAVDGEELRIPFRLHVGRNYEAGEQLEAVAYREAADFLSLCVPPGTREVRIDVYEVTEEGTLRCLADSDPSPVASATATK